MRRLDLALLTTATIVALAGARPYAAGWNDGGRLATMESLVDRGTFAIDGSIFVEVPANGSPYPADQPELNRTGTLDKMRINGRFYSDKPPTSAVLLAGYYKVIQTVCGLTAREKPRTFCWLMTVAGSGLAYVVAVWSTWRIGRSIGLSPNTALLLAAVMGCGTLSLPYVRHVSGHIQELAVTAAMLQLMTVAGRDRQCSLGRLALLGALAGLGYSIDVATGTFLLVGAAGWAGFRFGYRGALMLSLGALPFAACHHALTYAIAGTFGPPGAVPEYFAWPGAPFDPATLTGKWHHPSLDHFQMYLQQLLVGDKGFLLCNPILFLAFFVVPLLRRAVPERPELVCAGFWALGSFLLHGATSVNWSGLCLSIRWFVPLLAPGLFAVAVLLRERPAYRGDAIVLGVWGAAIALSAWPGGPWLDFSPFSVKRLATIGFTAWGVFRIGSWLIGGWRLARKSTNRQTATARQSLVYSSR